MLLRNDPFRDFDRLTARVFDTNRESGARLDAYRDGDVFVIDIDLPGVQPADIEVTIDRKVLTVRAQRRRVERDGITRLVTERSMGVVTRRLVLSDTLDTDHLEANYDAGVLTLSIPVIEKARARKIEITAGGTREMVAA